MPQEMKKEITFNKYIKRGDYHWRGIDKQIGNLFNFNAFLYERYQQVLNKFPYSTKRIRVIDIGCGDGALSAEVYKSMRGELVGVDPSADAIHITKRKFSENYAYNLNKYKFIIATGYKIPYADCTFDYAILADVIEHVGEPERLLNEIKRILKPSGKLILSSVVKLSAITQDKLHFREYKEGELQIVLKKYFKKVDLNTSHPVIIKNLYQIYFQIGRFKPQPFRYLINLLVIIFGLNLFRLKFKPSACQTVTMIK